MLQMPRPNDKALNPIRQLGTEYVGVDFIHLELQLEDDLQIGH